MGCKLPNALKMRQTEISIMKIKACQLKGAELIKNGTVDRNEH
jgi:hypothetical protein